MTQKPHETIVYRDEQFTLKTVNGSPYLTASGTTYALSCHPYEPCLYITGGDDRTTAVHNAFDPYVVLEAISRGEIFTSITGRRYSAEDFCMMTAYAAGKGELSIDEAERVLTGAAQAEGTKKKSASALPQPPDQPPAGCYVVTENPFYDTIADYPDSAVDWCLVRDSLPYCGEASHRRALIAMCAALFYDPEDDGWRCDPEKAAATPLTAEELFTRDRRGDRLTYRRAFLDPPYGNGYSDGDFERINAVLFPAGTDGLEICEWSTDWSDYFDAGHEWRGALCLTVYDRLLDRYVVITSSETD